MSFEQFKLIMNDIFIPPLINIIHEYAKCYYCAYVKRCITSRTQDSYKYSYLLIPHGLFIYLNKRQELHNGSYVFCTPDKWDFGAVHYSGWPREFGASGNIDVIVYYIVHSEICKLDKNNKYNIKTQQATDHIEMSHKIKPEITYFLKDIGVKIKKIALNDDEVKIKEAKREIRGPSCLCQLCRDVNLCESYIDIS